MKGLTALVYAASAIIIRDDVPDAEYRALATRPEFAAATRILVDSAGSGSGVLITPRWVVTAAHVVANAKPAALIVQIGNNRFRVGRIVIHPEYSKHSGFSRTAFDQALLQLEGASTTAPARIDARLPELNALVTMVGYGVGGAGARDTAGTLRAAHNRIDQIGGMMRTIPLANNLLLMDFDTAQPGIANTLGSGTPEPLEGIASGGDSGGGLFVHRDGEWYLTGTFSVSSVSVAASVSRNFAGSFNIFVGIAANRGWIESVVRPGVP